MATSIQLRLRKVNKELKEAKEAIKGYCTECDARLPHAKCGVSDCPFFPFIKNEKI